MAGREVNERWQREMKDKFRESFEIVRSDVLRANYGSNHYDEHPLQITGARVGTDSRSVTLEIPALAPTQCYELKLRLAGKSGESIEHSLHGTIHRLGE